MTNPAPQQKPLSEKEKAAILADYLEAVDSGQAFSAPKELADAELLELTRLARQLKTTHQESGPSPELLQAYDAPAQKSVKLGSSFRAFLALPIAAVAVLVVAFSLSLSDSPINDSSTIAVAPSTEQIAELDTALANLTQVEGLSELDQLVDELDIALEEMEALLDEEAFADMDNALAVAEL